MFQVTKNKWLPLWCICNLILWSRWLTLVPHLLFSLPVSVLSDGRRRRRTCKSIPCMLHLWYPDAGTWAATIWNVNWKYLNPVMKLTNINKMVKMITESVTYLRYQSIMTSLRNSPSLRQKRSALCTGKPAVWGGGGYVNNLKQTSPFHLTCWWALNQSFNQVSFFFNFHLNYS